MCGVMSATDERLFLALIDRFWTFNAQSAAKVISGEPQIVKAQTKVYLNRS